MTSPRYSPFRAQCFTAWALTLSLILFLGFSASAQTVELDASKRWDPRTLSLGDATSGEANTINSILANPAALGLLQSPASISLSSAYDSDLNRLTQRLTLPLLMDTRHSVAVSGSFHTQGDRALALNTDPVLRSYPDVNQYDMDLYYSLSFSGKLTLGAGIITSYIDRGDADVLWTRFARLGLMYRPDPSISYGIVYSGLGDRPVFLLDELPLTDLESNQDSGNSDAESMAKGALTTSQPAISSASMGDRIQIASTFRYPYEFAPTRFTLTLASEKVFSTSGLSFKGGLEYYVTEWFILRSGFLIQTRLDDDGARFGAGLRTGGVQLDYGIVASEQRKEYVHQLSLVLPFRRGGR